MLAPKTVRRNSNFTVSVSILRATGNVRVTAELKDSVKDSVLVSNSTNVASGNKCHCVSVALKN